MKYPLAVRSFVAAAVGVGLALSFAGTARAAVIATTYTGGGNPLNGAHNGTIAVAFAPTADFELTGASLLMTNMSLTGGALAVPVSIFSSNGGQPGVSIATLSMDLLPASTESTVYSGLVSGIYTGPTLVLDSGSTYFLVATVAGAAYWRIGGDPSTTYVSGFNGWNGPYSITVQYQVFGNAVEQTSEPTTLTPEPASLLLFGAGLLGLAGLRRRVRANTVGDSYT